MYMYIYIYMCVCVCIHMLTLVTCTHFITSPSASRIAYCLSRSLVSRPTKGKTSSKAQSQIVPSRLDHSMPIDLSGFTLNPLWRKVVALTLTRANRNLYLYRYNPHTHIYICIYI